MDRHTVTAVAEKASGISDRDGVESHTNRLHQSLAAPGPALPEQRLQLGKRLFYGVSMRRYVLSRANVVTRGDSAEPVPLNATFPFALWWAGYERPGARWDPSGYGRCHLRFGLPQIAAAIPHLAVAGNERGVLGLPPSSPLPKSLLGCRGALSGCLAPATARVVERFVDLRRDP